MLVSRRLGVLQVRLRLLETALSQICYTLRAFASKLGQSRRAAIATDLLLLDLLHTAGFRCGPEVRAARSDEGRGALRRCGYAWPDLRHTSGLEPLAVLPHRLRAKRPHPRPSSIHRFPREDFRGREAVQSVVDNVEVIEGDVSRMLDTDGV